MKFTICSVCSIPPNFIVTELPSKQEPEKIIYSIKCRDCGDHWDEEPEEDD